MMSSKYYKEKYSKFRMELRGKRGQITIFVIVAVVLVLALLIFLLYPKISPILSGESFSPISYLRGCVEPDIKDNIATLAKNAGYESILDGYTLYQGEKVKYLCYSSENYKTCIVQQPMIKQNFENELKKIIEPKADACLESLKKEYEKRGYSVSASRTDSRVSIIPGKIRIDFLTPMTITKDKSQTYKGFEVGVTSEMYDLLFIAQSIIDFESTYGDSETTLYMQYYPDLKIEKTKLSEGTTIYKISNVLTKEEFIFASRSLVWPPGYGIK